MNNLPQPAWSTWVMAVLLTAQFIIGRLMGDAGDVFGVSPQAREALAWVTFAITVAVGQLKPVGSAPPGTVERITTETKTITPSEG